MQVDVEWNKRNLGVEFFSSIFNLHLSSNLRICYLQLSWISWADDCEDWIILNISKNIWHESKKEKRHWHSNILFFDYVTWNGKRWIMIVWNCLLYGFFLSIKPVLLFYSFFPTIFLKPHRIFQRELCFFSLHRFVYSNVSKTSIAPSKRSIMSVAILW